MKKITLGVILSTLFLLAFTIPNHQLMPTSLRVTVLDDAGNVQKNAKVTLYLSQEDYDKEQNPVGESQTTNDKGFATFRSLETKVYYMTVSKGDMDNAGASIKTDALKSGVLNKVNVIIE
jgi:hypothetical protein